MNATSYRVATERQCTLARRRKPQPRVTHAHAYANHIMSLPRPAYGGRSGCKQLSLGMQRLARAGRRSHLMQ
jgi:hypothetical protein